jgi:hypothetical protein
VDIKSFFSIFVFCHNSIIPEKINNNQVSRIDNYLNTRSRLLIK